MNATPDNATTEFTYRGRTFHLAGASAADHILAAIRAKGTFYEISLLEYIAHFVRPAGGGRTVAVDVGANLGNHSVYFRSFLADWVIAVEPNPKVTPVLRENLARNVDQVALYEVGLGAAASRAAVAVPEDAGDNLGMAQLEVGGGEIEIRTLDEVVGQWRDEHATDARVALLKVDVEGMELAVLEGGRQTLATDRPHVLLEAATEAEFVRQAEFLARFGYQHLTRHGATPLYHYSYQPSYAMRLYARALKSFLNRRRKARRAWRRIVSG